MGCSESVQREVFINNVNRKATIINWDVEAGRIHRAFNSANTADEDAIIQLLANHKSKSRQRIIQAYKKVYSKDLLSVLEDELSNGYKQVAQALLYKSEVYAAKSLHEAIGGGDDNDTIIEIICSSKASDSEKIKDSYEDEFNCSLENDLLNIKDQDLRDVLIKFCTVNRDGVRSKADRLLAQERAIRLQSYGDLVELLCEPLGRNQLKATFDEFEALYLKTMDVYIDSQYKNKSVDFRKALKAYVACTISPPTFFTTEINKALDKTGRSKSVLRIVVTRSETDLYYIIKEYLSTYQVHLQKAISKKCLSQFVQPLKIILAVRGQYRESAVRM